MPRRMIRAARNFSLDRSGNIAIAFMFALTALLMAAGVAANYAVATTAKGELQGAADAAALAGAKELSLADSNRVNVPSVVQAVVDSFLGANIAPGAVRGYDVSTNIIDVANAPLQVDVKLTAISKGPFGSGLGLGPTKIAVESVATVVGKPNVCVLALDPSAMGTIYLQKSAKVAGQNCGVYSNSTHPNGIKAFNSSMLTASVICSAGGKAGSKGNFTPDPLTDCPQFDDPLAGVPEPAPGGCPAVSPPLVIANVTATLNAGVYCGGITIKGAANVTFGPGIYTIENGPLLVQDTASIAAVNAGFFFNGAKASFTFTAGASVNLIAPKSGQMAGLLFFASRSQANLQFLISSNNARQLLGTIYLPEGQLTINANAPVADQSAYTAIVARKLTADAGPTIVLNTNYTLTDVPVPNGIRGAGMPVELAR